MGSPSLVWIYVGQTFLSASSFPDFMADRNVCPTKMVESLKMILPVLDLLHGQIVRGIAGRRDAYRPIVSRVTDSAEPLAVARAIRTHFALDEFYLADLDAIQFSQPAYAVYDRLQEDGFRLWIDAGLRNERDVSLIPMADLIVGLESVEGPDALAAIVQKIGVERTIFSLDLMAGQPLGRLDLWGSADPWTIAERAIASHGIRRLIVLDLASVGVGAGIGTEELCVRVRQAFPTVQLTAGGGVRNRDDVVRLLALGIDRVLVASALHDGRLTAS
jgi:phosphoribosylformimino-5-aminoimidazole carboxamide ribotide isomerase